MRNSFTRTHTYPHELTHSRTQRRRGFKIHFYSFPFWIILIYRCSRCVLDRVSNVTTALRGAPAPPSSARPHRGGSAATRNLTYVFCGYLFNILVPLRSRSAANNISTSRNAHARVCIVYVRTRIFTCV